MHSASKNERILRLLVAVSVAILITLLWAGVSRADDEDDRGQPRYDGNGHLLLPEDYLQWRFVGSSLGLSYSEGGGGMEMFHHTLMEPTAYEHFQRTGTFREGTMFVLLLHGQGEGELPQRRGHFAAEVHAVEMAVKDGQTFADGWAYFGFGGMGGLRDRASAFDSRSCFSCHAEHAQFDNVFMQFYPLLAQTAPEGNPFQLARSSTEASPSHLDEAPEAGRSESEPAPTTTLAYGGLDPVHLLAGREELGKPEIIAEHGGYHFQFISEPSRARFVSAPTSYAPANDSCPVVEGATVEPNLFAVHDGRIYLFASSACVETFTADPTAYFDQAPTESSTRTSTTD